MNTICKIAEEAIWKTAEYGISAVIAIALWAAAMVVVPVLVLVELYKSIRSN